MSTDISMGAPVTAEVRVNPGNEKVAPFFVVRLTAAAATLTIYPSSLAEVVKLRDDLTAALDEFRCTWCEQYAGPLDAQGMCATCAAREPMAVGA